MSNCVRRLDGRRLEMSAPDDWIPVANASESCAVAGISHDAAAEKCQTLQEDTSFFEACIYDYCASDGDKALVENAIDSKQREVARSKSFPSATTTSTTVEPTSAAGQSKMCGNRYGLPSTNNASSWRDAGYLETCKKDCSLDPVCKAVTYEEDDKVWCFGCKDLASLEEKLWGKTWKWQQVESSFEEIDLNTAPTAASFSMLVMSAVCAMFWARSIW